MHSSSPPGRGDQNRQTSAGDSAGGARYRANFENKGVGSAESTKTALKSAPRQLESALVYSRSAWYAHPTASAVNHWFLHFGWDNGVNIDQTDDPMKFNLDDLARYQVLILNSTTHFGEDLTQEQRDAVISWFRQGRGIVAVHAAAVHHGVWDWYAGLVGCDFAADSERLPARLTVDPAAAHHPAVRRQPHDFWLTEEWLCFDRPVTGQPDVQVLLRLDETTFDPVREKFREMNAPPMGDDHPAAWTRETQGGRFFYTIIGHDCRVLNTEFGRRHMLEAMRWAAFETGGD
jgi:type 1 glutamine amidotransferase